MVDFLPEHNGAISDAICRFLDKKKAELSLVNSWGTDICSRLSAFATSGKMLRGKLVLLTYLMYRDSIVDSVLDAAAAIEILHSSILIHDDIIDNDLLRRGYPTIFTQYQKWGEDCGLPEPSSFGRAMGICAGDVGFMLAFEILSRLRYDPLIINKLLILFAQESTYVGIAQMQDILFTSLNNAVDDASLYNLYVYKTGRYTFSLPMIAGALIAKQDPKTQAKLGEIGKMLGVIYQIRDDELGLCGDQAKLGKPVGSDLREGKQTIYYIALARKADEKHKKVLNNIMKKQNIVLDDIDYVRRLIIELGVRDEIDGKVAALSSQIGELINAVDVINPVCRQTLLNLTEYVVNREE